MTTNDTDSTSPAVDPESAADDPAEVESELPATPPSKSTNPLGGWEPNSPPAS